MRGLPCNIMLFKDHMNNLVNIIAGIHENILLLDLDIDETRCKKLNVHINIYIYIYIYILTTFVVLSGFMLSVFFLTDCGFRSLFFTCFDFHSCFFFPAPDNIHQSFTIFSCSEAFSSY